MTGSERSESNTRLFLGRRPCRESFVVPVQTRPRDRQPCKTCREAKAATIVDQARHRQRSSHQPGFTAGGRDIGGSSLELCADPQLRRHPRLGLQFVRTRKIRTITDACQGDRHFQKPKVVSLLTSEDLSHCSRAERKRQCTRGSFNQILADVDFFSQYCRHGHYSADGSCQNEYRASRQGVGLYRRYHQHGLITHEHSGTRENLVTLGYELQCANRCARATCATSERMWRIEPDVLVGGSKR